MSWVRIGLVIGLLAVPACGTSGSGGIGAVSCGGTTQTVQTIQPGVVKIAITGTATDPLDPEAWMYRYAERLAAELALQAEWVVVPFDKSWELAGKDVVDGSLGTWLAPKHGDMRRNPLKITIADSRIVDLECDNEEALEDFRRYVSHAENGNRVGEFALGTNTAVRDVIGNMLQDEKIPGVHIAFGHPYSEHAGADWTSETHIDVVGRDFDVWFDGVPIMKHGKYLNGEV